MKIKEIKSILENFGFSANESKVYLAMVNIGEALISDIAKEAKLNRITTHHIIERLEKRGFAVCFGPNRSKKARALHPTALSKRITEQSKEFEKIVPEIIASMRDENKKKPTVRMYYGVSGFEKVAEELLERPNTTIRHIGSLNEAYKFIGLKYDVEYFVPTRMKKNIHYRMICYQGEESQLIQTNNATELREVKYVPKGFKLTSNVFIAPGKVVIVTTKNELMSIVIESEDISHSEEEKFDMIWNLLK
ncbi:MAG: hypothetical protein KBC12_02030 [Candidatus Pacebacteria bacterium]|jgi:sugar-specific transcriptional regulator TrmB|nr:hypothetical protein [Candidatus Paceibacterota bacterium]MBP9851200.1 hypothetical protein [Candidatus Paceibacterota bacterium]